MCLLERPYRAFLKFRKDSGLTDRVDAGFHIMEIESGGLYKAFKGPRRQAAQIAAIDLER